VRQALQFVVAFGIVSACATSSVLPRTEAVADARLNTRSLGTKWMCVAHRRVPIVPDAHGYVRLPVGERVTLGADEARDLQRFGAPACVAGVSFVPRAGRSYFLGIENQGGHCTAFVYREIKTNRTGLGLEPTLGPPADCLDGESS
jgi:hypothetical protein